MTATHLVGGYMHYAHLGGTLYRVTIDVYRDCNSATPFDKPGSVMVGAYRDTTGSSLIRTFTMSQIDSFAIPIESLDPCAPPPSGLCYFRAVYTTEVNINVPPSGAVLSWARCCRTPTITNLLNPDQAGMTLTCVIPPVPNSSPVFNAAMPVYTCAAKPVVFDFSVNDPNGDSLSYEFVLPFTSDTTAVPPPKPPPYPSVQFAPGYTSQAAFGGASTIALNPQNGQLTLIPNQLGQFVFAVGVQEHRNGIRLGTLRRDVQLNVVACPVNVAPVVSLSLTGENVGDTMIFRAGRETCQSLRASDVNGIGFGLDSVFVEVVGALPGTTGTPAAFVFTPGLAPQTATLCWLPACNETQVSGSLLLRVRDNSACPAPNILEKTFFYKVLPPIPVAPELRCVSVPDPAASLVDLTWILPDSQANPVGVVIERDSGVGFVALDTLPWGATTWRDLNANRSTGATYRYRLRTLIACPTAAVSAPGNVAGILQTVASVQGNQRAIITWSDYPRNGFSDYVLRYSDSTGTGIEGIFSDNSHQFVPCLFHGTMQATLTDSITGCEVLGVPTDTFVIDNGLSVASADLCGVSVEDGHPLLQWPLVDEVGVLRYTLLRQDTTSQQFEALLDTMLPYFSQWHDLTADAGSRQWCYKIRVTDPCGRIVETETHCTVWLEGKAPSRVISLNWQPYTISSLSRNVMAYQVWLTPGDEYERQLTELSLTTRNYRDEVQLTGPPQHCYRVAAITEAQGQCAVGQQFSNDVCLPFAPIVLLPTAFTPNGDGINNTLTYQAFFVVEQKAEIYDRWGHLAWQSTVEQPFWDGTLGNAPAPEGTYWLRVFVTGADGNSKSYQLPVALIR